MPPDPATSSRDALLDGRIHLRQPATGGLRAGHDALLVACAVPQDAKGRLLDMGAGTGAVGLVAAARSPGLTVALAERDAGLAALLRRTTADAPAELRSRLSVTELDLLATRGEREAAGLADGAFDWIATNPPFHPSGGRLSPDPLRAAALAMPDPGFLTRWMHVAAALLRHGGRFVLLARPDSIGSILDGAENRFGALSLRPVHASPSAPASRLLIGAVRGSRAPLRLLPSFVLDGPARRRLSSGEDMPSPFG